MKKMVPPHLEEEEEGYHQHAQHSPKPMLVFVSPTSEFSITCGFRSPSVVGLEPRRALSCSLKVDVWLFGGLDTQSTQVHGRFILLCCVGGGRQCCNHSLTSLCNLALDRHVLSAATRPSVGGEPSQGFLGTQGSSCAQRG